MTLFLLWGRDFRLKTLGLAISPPFSGGGESDMCSSHEDKKAPAACAMHGISGSFYITENFCNAKGWHFQFSALRVLFPLAKWKRSLSFFV